jgi:hypothetical protein
MKRWLLFAALTAGCAARFQYGAVKGPVKPPEVTLELAGCTASDKLFDCKSAPAVVAYFVDYFQLNGIRRPVEGAIVPKARVRIFDSMGAVAVEVVLGTGAGTMWESRGDGATLVRALAALEKILDREAFFHVRFLSADPERLLKQLGKKEARLEKTAFIYQ